MEDRNPFQEADHINEPPSDLRERILRSATDKKGLMALAGLFTGSYLTSFFELLTGATKRSAQDPTKAGGPTKTTEHDQRNFPLE